jgi:hypothetical protein
MFIIFSFPALKTLSVHHLHGCEQKVKNIQTLESDKGLGAVLLKTSGCNVQKRFSQNFWAQAEASPAVKAPSEWIP